MTDEETLSLTKIEKAHKVLEDLQRLLTQYRHISKELTEANGIAISALEKQIPKEPNNIGRFDSFGMRYCKCPRCGGGINMDQRWCPNCGQKIDWSDNE